jgi:hypothetical protein
MGYALKILFVGYQVVAESWFIMFEVDLESKYAEVSMAWFSAIAVLVGFLSWSVTFLTGQELTMWMV